MLSFPAQNWQKALASAKIPDTGSGRVASRITPRLYLSDYGTARNLNKLEELGITHVISVIELIPNLPEAILHTRRLHLPLPDLAEANILEHLDTTTVFITAALEESETNKVLVSSLIILHYSSINWVRFQLEGSLHARSQPQCDRSLRLSDCDNKFRCWRVHCTCPINPWYRLSKHWFPTTARTIRNPLCQAQAKARPEVNPRNFECWWSGRANS